MGGQCRRSTVCGVAVSGKRRLPSSRWLPNLPNLGKSVSVLDKSVAPFLFDITTHIVRSSQYYHSLSLLPVVGN